MRTPLSAEPEGPSANMRVRHALCRWAALCCGLLVGCSLLDGEVSTAATEPGARVPIRFHLASAQAQEGWPVFRDEYGQLLYIEPEPVLTQADIADATALHGERGSIVVLRFKLVAAARLESFTAEHVGDRFAVFVEGRLVVSPMINARVTEGALALDVGMSRELANRIVGGYSAPVAGRQ